MVAKATDDEDASAICMLLLPNVETVVINGWMTYTTPMTEHAQRAIVCVFGWPSIRAVEIQGFKRFPLYLLKFPSKLSSLYIAPIGLSDGEFLVDDEPSQAVMLTDEPVPEDLAPKPMAITLKRLIIDRNVSAALLRKVMNAATSFMDFSDLETLQLALKPSGREVHMWPRLISVLSDFLQSLRVLTTIQFVLPLYYNQTSVNINLSDILSPLHSTLKTLSIHWSGARSDENWLLGYLSDACISISQDSLLEQVELAFEISKIPPSTPASPEDHSNWASMAATMIRCFSSLRELKTQCDHILRRHYIATRSPNLALDQRDRLRLVYPCIMEKVKTWGKLDAIDTFCQHEVMKADLEDLHRRLDAAMAPAIDFQEADSERAQGEDDRIAQELRRLLCHIFNTPNDLKTMVQMLREQKSQKDMELIMKFAQLELMKGSLTTDEMKTYQAGLWHLYSETKTLPPLAILNGQITLKPHDLSGNGPGEKKWIMVLLQILPRQLSQNEDLRQKFEIEILKARQFNHSQHNLAPIFGVVDIGSDLYLVSSWTNQGTLLDHARADTIDHFKCLMEVARGLEFLHSKGMIHGSLYARNILVSQNQKACITYYGVMSFLERHGSGVVDISEILDCRRSAPEVTINRRPLSTASDIWSFGMLALEVLTGERPFDDISPDIWVLSHLERLQNSTCKLSDQIDAAYPLSPEVKQFLDDCWNFDPSERMSIDLLPSLKRLKRSQSSPGALVNYHSGYSTNTLPEFDDVSETSTEDYMRSEPIWASTRYTQSSRSLSPLSLQPSDQHVSVKGIEQTKERMVIESPPASASGFPRNSLIFDGLPIPSEPFNGNRLPEGSEFRRKDWPTDTVPPLTPPKSTRTIRTSPGPLIQSPLQGSSVRQRRGTNTSGLSRPDRIAPTISVHMPRLRELCDIFARDEAISSRQDDEPGDDKAGGDKRDDKRDDKPGDLLTYITNRPDFQGRLAPDVVGNPVPEPKTSIEMAQALTFHQGEQYRAIDASDYLDHLMMEEGPESSINEALNTHNAIVLWAQNYILSGKDIKEQLSTSLYLIDIAHECKHMSNLASMFAIGEALHHDRITGLPILHKLLTGNSTHKERLQKLHEDKYESYTKKASNHVFIPCLGYHLKNIRPKRPKDSVLPSLKEINQLMERVQSMVSSLPTPAPSREGEKFVVYIRNQLGPYVGGDVATKQPMVDLRAAHPSEEKQSNAKKEAKKLLGSMKKR
ncbi:hypothetical protein CVT24_005125 [Panaeolus cyanescens]|uniref:Protein kinase domain-containing protein n=1 Tax=Panaeolus cyanescens TaxID=181874 RepID=A0A409W253_9AGAR|nr:hypothetical protein CVT24_005125 [Panaeolus cyanescens]